MSERLEPMDKAALDAFMKAEDRKIAGDRGFFQEHLHEWATTHAGQWALIRDRAMHGFFDSFEKAYDEGNRRFPDQDLYIKCVTESATPEPMSMGLLHGVLVVDE